MSRQRIAIGLSMLLAVLSCNEDGGASDGTDTDAETGGAGFNFATETPDQYTRADRAGMPAVATAVITSKDMYNQSNPEDDAAGTFVPEITDIVVALHDALDDDLMGLGLVPCAPDACLMQAAPLVVPDTLKIDPSMPAGFPNGRTLPDPVIDVTLAVVMLDLSVEGQTPTTLADVPVNPPANDVAFMSEFPYLAAPHQ